MAEELSKRQEEFLDAFGQLMREYSDVAGPVDRDSLPEREDGIYSAEELAEGQPVKNAALSEWIILSSWVDLDNGRVYTSGFCMPGMPTHHRTGLLLCWYESWR